MTLYMLVIFYSFAQLDITLIQLAISVNPVQLDITAIVQVDVWDVQMVLTAQKDQHYVQIVLQATGNLIYVLGLLCFKYSGNVFCEWYVFWKYLYPGNTMTVIIMYKLHCNNNCYFLHLGKVLIKSLVI